MHFKFWLNGRERGAIGSFYDMVFCCESASEGAAIAFLHELREVNVIKLITRSFRVTFDTGATIETEMNATLEEATRYYLDNPEGFRLSYDESGPLLKAVKVEQI